MCHLPMSICKLQKSRAKNAYLLTFEYKSAACPSLELLKQQLFPSLLNHSNDLHRRRAVLKFSDP